MTTPVYVVRERNGEPVLEVDNSLPGEWPDVGRFYDQAKAIEWYRKLKIHYVADAERLIDGLRAKAAEARRLAVCEVRREQ